jgi:DNA-binding transcriptional regulator LsrR (DeoR family)
MDVQQRLLERVALLYYEENLTQEEVAARLCLSRSKVVRLLQEARRTGIVQIRVLAPHHANRDLERRLESRFGLLQVVVAASARSDVSDTGRTVAHEAAAVLSHMLKPGLVIAMASGTTMQAVAEAIPQVRVPDVRVIELHGMIQDTGLTDLNARPIVARIAQRLGAEYSMLPVLRELASAEFAAALLRDTRIQRTLELGRQADVLLVGVGAIQPLSPSLAPLAPEVLAELRHAGAVGEISARFFDQGGQACPSTLDARLVSLPLADLVQVPTRIGVAFGAAKVAAIAGALAGQYINTLVTDVPTATSLLAYSETAGRTHKGGTGDPRAQQADRRFAAPPAEDHCTARPA